jgi:sulfite reductase alpha subunit-like flavoprotein
VLANRRLTEAEWQQDVRQIELDLGSSSMHYFPGDVAYIIPRNSMENVDYILGLLQMSPTLIIEEMRPRNEDIPDCGIRFPISLKDLLCEYYDITATPRRYFFELLSHFATDERHREKLLEFASNEGQEELRWYCHRVHRSIIQVFEDLPSARPPLEYLLEMVPRIKPRAFSISSCQKVCFEMFS